MTSTNHFRNRRLGGSQRALIRKGCDCPPATTAPPVTPYVELAATGFTDDTINVSNFGPLQQPMTSTGVNSWTTAFNNANAQPCHVDLVINPIAGTWTGELWCFDGANDQLVATGSGTWTTPTPATIVLWFNWSAAGGFQGSVDGWVFAILP